MRTALQTTAHTSDASVTISSTIEDRAAASHADELCDKLMIHTFDCDDCINGREDSCPTFCGLRDAIEQAGGPTKGAALAM